MTNTQSAAPAQPKTSPDSSAPRQKRRGLRISLRFKLLVAFTLLFSVVFAGAYYWFYTFAVNSAIDQIEISLKNSLLGATKEVNVPQLLDLHNNGIPDTTTNYGTVDAPVYLTNDPRYQAQLDWLQTVHNIEPRAWPYIYVKSDQAGEVVVLADLWARYDPNRAFGFDTAYSPSRPYFVMGLSSFQFNTNNDGSFRIYTDKWGSWTTAYAPIYDSTGQIVAAMGMDFEAKKVYEVQDAIKNAIVPAFGLTYATLFLMVLLISRVITNPVAKLTQIARRIGEGDYNQNLSNLSNVRLRDEISVLAEVFETMVGKVRQREETLKQEVTQLRVEVDEARRTKQVSEIVETEFFKDLQVKAQSMRNRRHTGPGAAAGSATGSTPAAPAPAGETPPVAAPLAAVPAPVTATPPASEASPSTPVPAAQPGSSGSPGD
ncbi:MAG: HAMP domain-containing protein [Aggregatilineales bacterium]